MKYRRGRSPTALLLTFITLLLLSSCGGTSSEPAAGTSQQPGEQAAGGAAAAPTAANGGQAAGPAPKDQSAEADSPGATPIPHSVAFSGQANRQIIKNAELTIEVDDVALAMSRISGVAAQSGGYLLDSRTQFNNQTAASAVVQIAVPVERFELALGRIRESGRVLNEQASGSDVTQEFVDIQSQIANLEATQARIREFLGRAQTVEEALRVNAQLSEIEGQISQLKGRLQFLSGRAAFSTITIKLQQAPQAVPVATPTPTPAPVAWDPGGTTRKAFSALTAVWKVLGTLGIWLVVFVLPLVLPAAALVLAVRAVRSRTARLQVGNPAPAALGEDRKPDTTA